MNLIRSSKLTAAFAVFVLLVTAVAPAAAVTANATDAPEEAKVGTTVTGTFTLTDLYDNYESWTLNGQTELTDVTWKVIKYNQAGSLVGQRSYDGQSFNESISLNNDNVEKVEVKVTGTVPAVENYTYDPAQTFTLAKFNQVRQGGNSQEIDVWETHYFTKESSQARDALDSAAAAIDAAKQQGVDTSEMESTFANGVSTFENKNFGTANDIAAQVEENAQSSKESSERTGLLLTAGGGLLALVVLVGGGLYLYRSRQDNYDKLA